MFFPRMQRLWALILAVGMQLLFALGIANAVTLAGLGEKVSPGVRVAGVEIGGLARSEAEQLLAANISSEAPEVRLIITDGERQWYLRGEEIKATADFSKSVARAFHYIADSFWLEKLSRYWALQKAPVDLPLSLACDEAALDEYLAGLEREINLPVQDASLEWENGQVILIRERAGKKLNLAESKERIKEALAAGGEGPVVLAVEECQPRLRGDDLAGINSLLGEYTTSYSLKDKDRVSNVELAASSLNGVLVRPGEVFSFNQAVGPRTEERGYKKAPVFQNQRLIRDTGGGVCQVATTLYNALLRAGLPVKERWPHSQVVSYVPPGQDASVREQSADLKFENTTGFPVYIRAAAARGTLAIQIFGTAEKEGVVRYIITEKETVPSGVVVRYDPSLQDGEARVESKGRNGLRVRVYRITREGGKEIGRELISEDYYSPQPRVIRSGTGQSGTGQQAATPEEQKTEEQKTLEEK